MKFILKFLVLSFIGLLMSQAVFAGEAWLSLSTYSFHNNKTILVNDTNGNKKGIKVKVKATFRGEPAGSPMYLSTWLQCPGTKNLVPVDLASFLKGRYGDKVLEFLGKPTKNYPAGQMHVCSLENVNFDENVLLISVLRAGPEGCSQRAIIDFMFPIKDLCQ